MSKRRVKRTWSAAAERRHSTSLEKSSNCCFPRPLRKQEAGPLPGFKSEAAHCTHGAMTYQRVDARANAIIQLIWNVTR